MVLGHIAKSNEGGVPYEQQMGRYRHSPGSGKLVVEVISDGPTRLLQIRDRVPKVREGGEREREGGGEIF